MPNPINPTASSSLTAPISLGPNPNTDQKFRLDSTHLQDVYSFTTTAASNLNIALKDLTGNADIKIYDSTKADITASLGSGTGANTATLSESLIKNGLAAGTYYVSVSLGSKATQADYTLSVLDNQGSVPEHIFWQTANSFATWGLSGAKLTSPATLVTNLPDWKVVGSGDFNGDGSDDVVLVNRGTSPDNGKVAIWLTDGTTFLSTGGSDFVRSGNQTATDLPAVLPAGWEIKAIADFNGDGNSDLLWYNTQTAVGAVWIMNGAKVSPTASKFLPTLPVGWTIEAVADFSGKDAQGASKADILWRNAATGQAAIWIMDGATPTTSSDFIGDPGPGWKVTGTGYFNNDDKADLVWSNPVTGKHAIWLMDGKNVLAGSDYLGLVDPNWSIVGIGDTDGDKKSDLFWRNSVSNEMAIWVMNGTGPVVAAAGTPPKTALLANKLDANWQILTKNRNANFDLKNDQKALVDFNNDGNADLFWRNLSTRELAIWTLNGGSLGPDTNFVNADGFGQVKLGAEWQNAAFLATKSTKPVVQSTAGASKATAFNIGTLVGDGSADYVDNVGSAANLTDDYTFTLTSDYLLGFNATSPISPAAAAVDTKLYLVGKDAAGAATYTLTTLTKDVPIGPGTYIIEVTPSGTAAVDYKLHIDLVEPVVELSGVASGFSVDYKGKTEITLVNIDTTPSTTPVTLKYKVQNTGNYSVANVEVEFYLSSDNVITPNSTTPPNKTDKYLGVFTIPTIAPGVNSAYDGTVTLNLPAGDDDFWDTNRTYTIGMVINPTNDLNRPNYVAKKEINLANNFNVADGQDKSALVIKNVQKPDLIGTSVAPRGAITSGQPTTIDYSLANIGKKSTDASFFVTLYFVAGSTRPSETAFNPSDPSVTKLKEENYTNLNGLGKLNTPSSTGTGSVTATILGAAGSQGYLVLVVDTGVGNVIEEIEDNNVFVGSLVTLA
jgi:Bacterial pre-peptidase C-terminal domain/FG-GAP repeat